VVPFACFGTQFGAAQKFPDAQSVSAAHVVLQAVAPHAKAPQLVVVPALQSPTPSHFPIVVCAPLEQLALPHVALVVG
jgi:hypothetical protein